MCKTIHYETLLCEVRTNTVHTVYAVVVRGILRPQHDQLPENMYTLTVTYIYSKGSS